MSNAQNKRFEVLGEPTLHRGNIYQSVDVIPTGSLALDIALGVGGIPRGSMIEIFGPESSGKTTLAQHIIAETQKLGNTAAFIDMEHAFNSAYATICGVDANSLLVAQPETGEQALEITETLVRSGAVDLIVIDSVAALVPRTELDGNFGDEHQGLMARLMTQALRKLSGVLKHTSATIIFTNQIRYRIGKSYGNPETTPGGNALKFYASVRIDMRHLENVELDGEIIGNRSRARVVKNKVAPPFRNAELNILHNEGISKIGEIVDLACELEIISQQGAFYQFDNLALGRERHEIEAFLQQNRTIAEEIETVIRLALLPHPRMPLAH